MTPQELKNSILQLAIQGKLVEQRPEEGTAEELFAHIQEKKLRLIKEKKIRKEKGEYGEFKEEEILFDVPSTWKWVRFGSIMINRDSERIPLSVAERNKLEKTFDYYGASGIIDKVDRYLFDKTLLLIGEDGANLLARSTPIAFLAKGKYWVNNHAHVLDCVAGTLSLEYMMYFVNAISLAKYVTGTAQPKMNQEKMNSIPVPLPPFAEQKRIVAKIEELLPYIDRYKQAWSKLEKFNSRFSEDMKKSLLQYAIQGKLVEQRSEEGTAEELFEQIQEEKHRLIKEKKIKKEKPLPEITDDEKPFDIPESWKWVRVGEIFAHNTGKAMNSSAKKVNKAGAKRKFITTSNLYWNSFDFSSVKEMFFSDDELERCTVRKGDLLMCEGGAYYGRTAIWNYDYDICFQNNIHRLRSYKPVELLFFYHLFYFYKSMNMMKAKGTAMPGLSSQTLHQMVLPLPPLSEQKRIVEKLERLLPLCEQLK